MEIRLLQKEDAESYQNIRLEGLKNHPFYFAASYEEEKTQSAEKYKETFNNPINSFTFAAFLEGELTGVVTLIRRKTHKLSHRTSIVAMYTKKEKRGLSIGRSLMKAAIRKARELDEVEQIHLTVVRTNHAAKNLYSSLGFKIIVQEEKALKYKGK